jgi:hypothetical protein
MVEQLRACVVSNAFGGDVIRAVYCITQLMPSIDLFGAQARMDERQRVAAGERRVDSGEVELRTKTIRQNAAGKNKSVKL